MHKINGISEPDQAIRPIVVKVGGSLFSLADLGKRLRCFLDRIGSTVIIVPGGGSLANAVRHLDSTQGLGQESAHWLALHSLSVNAWFVKALLSQRNAVISARLERFASYWCHARPIVLDALAFVSLDERAVGCLPHNWNVTSDSVAARVAVLTKASELILLKSADMDQAIEGANPASSGLVDSFFLHALQGPGAIAKSDIQVRIINFRQWQPWVGQ